MAIFSSRPRPIAINLAQTTVRGASRRDALGPRAERPPPCRTARLARAAHRQGTGRALVTTVRVARSFEEADELRPAWDRLQNDHITSDIDFLLTYCRHTQGVVRPHIVLLEENGEPVALAAGRLEDTRLPARLGYKVVLNSRVRALTVAYGGLLGDAASMPALLAAVGDSVKDERPRSRPLPDARARLLPPRGPDTWIARVEEAALRPEAAPLALGASGHPRRLPGPAVAAAARVGPALFPPPREDLRRRRPRRGRTGLRRPREALRREHGRPSGDLPAHPGRRLLRRERATPARRAGGGPRLVPRLHALPPRQARGLLARQRLPRRRSASSPRASTRPTPRTGRGRTCSCARSKTSPATEAHRCSTSASATRTTSGTSATASSRSRTSACSSGGRRRSHSTPLTAPSAERRLPAERLRAAPAR